MLKRTLAGILVLAISCASAFAGPAEDLAAGVKKLADSTNYSWTIKTEGGFGQDPSDCKTEKAGYTTFNNIGMQEDKTPVVIKGDKWAAKTEAGWKTSEELLADNGDGGGFNPNMFLAMRISGFAAPAAQLAAITEKATNVKAADGVISADLTADAAKAILIPKPPRGMQMPFQFTVTNPKGDVKVWIKDGAVSKAVIHLTGSMSFNDQENPIDRTITLEIKDVGTTKVDVPDDAKKKLEAPTTAPAK